MSTMSTMASFSETLEPSILTNLWREFNGKLVVWLGWVWSWREGSASLSKKSSRRWIRKKKDWVAVGCGLWDGANKAKGDLMGNSWRRHIYYCLRCVVSWPSKDRQRCPSLFYYRHDSLLCKASIIMAMITSSTIREVQKVQMMPDTRALCAKIWSNWGGYRDVKDRIMQVYTDRDEQNVVN